VQSIKSFLVAKNLPRERVDPDILFDEVVTANNSAVGEFCDAWQGSCFAWHDGGRTAFGDQMLLRKKNIEKCLGQKGKRQRARSKEAVEGRRGPRELF
jgi:hypothetical protein